MGLLRNHTFWMGFIAGAVVGPVVLTKFAPGLKAKLPGQ